MILAMATHVRLLGLSFILFPALLLSVTTRATQEAPVLESIENGSSVKLEQQKGENENRESREAKAGDPINKNDKLVTAEATATIRYPDGSKVTVTPQSEFIVESKTQTTQWNKLVRGSVRGLITKTPEGSSTKPKFIIRTKTAVLGVRGTDFVMALDAAQGTAEVHTLEGSVEVARNEASLLTGKGTVVSDGQFVQAAKTGITSPGSFDKKVFLESFKKGPPYPHAGSAASSTAGSGAGSGGTAAGAGASAPSVAEAMPGETITLPSTSTSARSAFNTPTAEGPTMQEVQISENKNETRPKGYQLLAFQMGMFFTQLSNSTVIRALSLAWTPSIEIPVIPYLSARGQIGMAFAQQGDLSKNFFLTELQLYLRLTPLHLFFVEAGIGPQTWKSGPGYSALLKSVNVGLKLNLKVLDSVFMGVHFLGVSPELVEYRVGLGLSF